jgi:outer membrane protein assembly factor BamE
MFLQKVLSTSIIIACLSLSGCAYQMQIQQGVALKASDINALKIGMTKDQVTYLLGTPNLVDPYHPNTWYYIYTNKENRTPVDQKTGKVSFDATGHVSAYDFTHA